MTPIAKHKRKRTGVPDLREIADLHAQASKKLGLLMDEYQALLDTGKKGQARAALQRAGKLQTVVRAIEAQVKRSADS
jgi:hypothetical protein